MRETAPKSRRRGIVGILSMRGTPEDPGVPALTAEGVTMLSMDRPGKDVGFHHIPFPLWDRLPGVVTMTLDEGQRVKVMRRGDRRVTFFSEPEKVRR